MFVRHHVGAGDQAYVLEKESVLLTTKLTLSLAPLLNIFFFFFVAVKGERNLSAY